MNQNMQKNMPEMTDHMNQMNSRMQNIMQRMNQNMIDRNKGMLGYHKKNDEQQAAVPRNDENYEKYENNIAGHGSNAAANGQNDEQ